MPGPATGITGVGRTGGGGCFQGRVDRDQAIEPVEDERPPDDAGGDRQPQLCAVGDGTLVGTPVARLRTRMREQFRHAGVTKTIGTGNFYPSVHAAVSRFTNTGTSTKGPAA